MALGSAPAAARMVRHARSIAQQTESMMTDREARAARNQQKSLEAFLQQKARFDAMVAELQQMSADHFGGSRGRPVGQGRDA